ncbi:hypothetical protein [Methylophaga sp. OBS1]|jgi:hypothetical protein|uniref:hypothetical protein n=1 Tax=Methylophaga sp. OBS1 TaxID=2991933 RepID=UPI002252A2BA|nr:hypothetical protein [Methylophaga sp. OBS1]MCX4191478.1 hypothetical protein [Methylophaga sp. OBS1]MCX4191577.1 hypothetical protein [Methylophaga sp. OBS1]
MKGLVGLVQILIVIALLYPVYYIWDTSRVEAFCNLIKPGMSTKELQRLAETKHISLHIPNSNETGQWMTSVDSSASIDRFACVISGAVDKIASARLLEEE